MEVKEYDEKNSYSSIGMLIYIKKCFLKMLSNSVFDPKLEIVKADWVLYV